MQLTKGECYEWATKMDYLRDYCSAQHDGLRARRSQSGSRIRLLLYSLQPKRGWNEWAQPEWRRRDGGLQRRSVFRDRGGFSRLRKHHNHLLVWSDSELPNGRRSERTG